MTAGMPELARNEDAAASRTDRMIRIARYSVYPRAASEHAVQTGFTRGGNGDLLKLVAATPEPVGALLRIEIQDLDERKACDTLARVVDCSRSGTSRFELTLEALDAHRPRFVRRNGTGAQPG